MLFGKVWINRLSPFIARAKLWDILSFLASVRQLLKKPSNLIQANSTSKLTLGNLLPILNGVGKYKLKSMKHLYPNVGMQINSY